MLARVAGQAGSQLLEALGPTAHLEQQQPVVAVELRAVGPELEGAGDEGQALGLLELLLELFPGQRRADKGAYQENDSQRQDRGFRDLS